VFRNNRKKQKTNPNSRKFVKISTFLISHTLSSICFVCFDTGPKHRNKQKQTEKKFVGFAKKQTEKQPKQIEFRFVSVLTEKTKISLFRGPTYRERFLEIFSVCFDKILCFGCFGTGPKHRNKPKKKVFWFRETN
jgi:hypothetical protein